jgi:hypothetical protein
MPSNKIRSSSNKFTALLVWVFSAATIGVNLVVTSLSLSVVIILVLLSFAAWLMFWRPTLTIDAEGVSVQNPFSAKRINFADIQAVDGRFGLIILSNDKRFNILAITGRNSQTAREVFTLWQAWVEKNA